MSSIRRSDENSNPGLEINLDTAEIKLEAKNKPLVASNEGGAKKRLTAFEKKERLRLEKSGMKKGSLLKYFVKENPEEMQEPVCTARRINRRSSSSCNNNLNGELMNADMIAGTKDGGGRGGSQSQNSDVEYLGAVSRNQSNVRVVGVPSDSDASVIDNDEFDADSDSPRVSEYDEDEADDDAVSSRHEDIVSPIDDIDNQLSSEDKIARWQRQNKRILQDEEETPTGKDCSDLKPPPSKASKLDDESQMCAPEDVTPEKPQSQDSNTSTPTLRIVSVYTLSSNNQATPGTSTVKPAVNSVEKEKVKKSILIYKEVDNPILNSLIEKKNWRKVIEVVKKDLKNYKLPLNVHVGQLIRKAILCEDTRVSKDVQSESLKLFEEIMRSYPPNNGNGRDLSVKYYKGVFENVFEDDTGKRRGTIKGSSLNFFLSELHKRLDMEKNALNVLILVTQLVANQYEVYDKGAGVKVNPPLFQYFLEEKEGIFRYNRYCEIILEKCFKAGSDGSDEEFCIYVKWVDLISRRLGKYAVKQEDYERMIKGFAKHCSEQDDYGLLVLMNLSYRPFLSEVCIEIFKKLKVVRANGDGRGDISHTDRCSYLMKLSKTLLIKPAVDIVKDVVEEVCKANNSLTFSNTRVDASDQNNQQNCDNHGKGRRKNVKGETRLHILCRAGQDNPVPDVRRHLQNYPEDINARDNFGNTPLHDCAKNNKGNIIVTMMELFEEGVIREVDFLARNKSQETAMHLAATYCTTQTTEILIFFATTYGVLDQVLTCANGKGELPFQLAPARSPILKKLTPTGYDKQAMLTRGGFTLDKASAEFLETTFEMRKVLAWWSQNCH